MMHPSEMLLGFASLAAAAGVFIYATSKSPEAVNFKVPSTSFASHSIGSLWGVSPNRWE